MKTKIWAIILVILCTIIATLAQVFYKLSMINTSFNLSSLIHNYYLWFGFFLYGFGAITLILALKGGELSVIYPILSLSYIWVFLISIIFFGELVNFSKLLGISFVVLGVILIGSLGK